MFKTITRNENFCGKSDWLWPEEDFGSWDGPTKDWIDSHSMKYFKTLQNKRTIITAGANCGLYVKQYAKIFENVYAFEPTPVLFHCLVNNVQEENVSKFQCALGKKNGFCNLKSINLTNMGMNSVEYNDNGKIAVVAIDSFNWINPIDMIQLDVEGFEYDILLGAEKTIEKYKPVIILENGKNQNILNIMNKLQYEETDQSISDTIYSPKYYK